MFLVSLEKDTVVVVLVVVVTLIYVLRLLLINGLFYAALSTV